MQRKKKTLRSISIKITSLKLNHPEGHIRYHKEKTTGRFYWVSLSFKREKILLFWRWKRLNKSSKKGKPQLICKCEGVCKRGFRLSWGTVEQLGGGCRAVSMNLCHSHLVSWRPWVSHAFSPVFVFSFARQGDILWTFSTLHGLRAQTFKLA